MLEKMARGLEVTLNVRCVQRRENFDGLALPRRFEWV